jgi:hypothetical protein
MSLVYETLAPEACFSRLPEQFPRLRWRISIFSLGRDRFEPKAWFAT